MTTSSVCSQRLSVAPKRVATKPGCTAIDWMGQCPPLESVLCLDSSLQSQGTNTHTSSYLSGASAPRSKAKHDLVWQQLSPRARCQVAASCRQLRGRTGACRAPLRAVSRSVGASSLRRDVAEGCCTRDRERAREEEREKERWFGLKARDATDKEGGRERVEWHLVTASRLETAETCQPAANEGASWTRVSKAES